jgi:hypothetical protein
VVVRSYEASEAGRGLLAREAQELAEHGYVPATQSEDGGHIHAGRLIMTGGLSVLAGQSGTRSSGSVTVTYRRALDATPAAPTTATLAQKLAQLDEAHAAGVLTDEEYRTKRAQVIEAY